MKLNLILRVSIKEAVEKEMFRVILNMIPKFDTKI